MTRRDKRLSILFSHLTIPNVVSRS
uniref:Uncharacterized protein n=1 Tax=Anguilla anguilla TaxID=7936 RepID=A0A0E9R2B5_ANGAN